MIQVTTNVVIDSFINHAYIALEGIGVREVDAGKIASSSRQFVQLLAQKSVLYSQSRIFVNADKKLEPSIFMHIYSALHTSGKFILTDDFGTWQYFDKFGLFP